METQQRVVATLAEVARAFNAPVATVYSWREAGMPGKPGAWDLGAITVWLEGREAARRTGTRSPYAPAIPESAPKNGAEYIDGEYWEARFRRARAKLSELELKVRRAELVPRAEILEVLVARAAGVRRGLRGLAKGLAPRLVGATAVQITRVIDAAHRELLLRYAAGPIPGVGQSAIDKLLEWLRATPKPPRRRKAKRPEARSRTHR